MNLHIILHILILFAKFLNCVENFGSKLKEKNEITKSDEMKTFDKSENEIIRKKRDTSCGIGKIPCIRNTTTDTDVCFSPCQRCDMTVNCPRAADEMGCPCRSKLHSSYICDGQIDCFDASDELGCGACFTDELKCLEGCVTLKGFCKGENCSDFSRAQMCSRLSQIQMEISEPTNMRSSGYLMKYTRGRWLKVCGTLGSEIEMSVNEYCNHISGLRNADHFYKLEASTSVESGNWCRLESVFNDLSTCSDVLSCPEKMIVYVECKPPTCQNNSLEKREKIRQIDLKPRVVGGEDAYIEMWSFFVRISKRGEHHCGGSIVTPRWVLSASHCFLRISGELYEIEAGIDRKGTYSPRAQRRLASHIIRHPDFDPFTMKNDVALVRLGTPLQLNRWTRPVCLPDAPDVLPAGTVCRLAGFGFLSEDGVLAETLKEVDLPILPENDCVDEFFFIDSEKVVCAGLDEGGKDSCQGDSGGPLMCTTECNGENLQGCSGDLWYQAGIVSYGRGCARPAIPGVYTRVSFYRKWIRESIAEVEKDPNQLPSVVPQGHCPSLSCLHETGSCLDDSLVCDGKVHCLDSSDETNCTEKPSTPVSPTPASPTAVTPTAVTPTQTITEGETPTDYYYEYYDYVDYSNELGINNETDRVDVCPSGHFKCTSVAGCVPNILLCDQERNCRDGTDEIGCTCVDRVYWSTRDRICDGVTDCPDFSDEFCELCRPNFWFCPRSLECIEISKRCDAIAHCRYGEDELNCLTLTPEEGEVIVDKEGKPLYSSVGYLVLLNPVPSNPQDTFNSSDSDTVDFVTIDTNASDSETPDTDSTDSDSPITFPYGDLIIWEPVCEDNLEYNIAADICSYLGFQSPINITYNDDLPSKYVIRREHQQRVRRSTQLSKLESEFKQPVTLKVGNYTHLSSVHQNFPKTGGLWKYLDLIKGYSNSPSSLLGKYLNDQGKYSARRSRRMTCSQVKIECGPRICGKISALHFSDAPPLGAASHVPWAVSVFTSGTFLCPGAIVGTSWVLSSGKCMENISLSTHSLYILGGSNRGYSQGDLFITPQEIEIRVDDIVSVPDEADLLLLLLHLEQPVDKFEQLNYICLNQSVSKIRYKECVVTGRHGNRLNYAVHLVPESTENCEAGKICFKANFDPEFCNNEWAGVIACRTARHRSLQWTAVAIWNLTERESCKKSLFSFPFISEDLLNTLDNLMSNEIVPHSPIACKGHGCPLGICLPSSGVCDAKVDCPDLTDEPLTCPLPLTFCHVSGSSGQCECSRGEFLCKDGVCLNPEETCDGVAQCVGGEDEENCKCSMIISEKRRECDGVIDCNDESDESQCHCKEADQFRCFKSETQNCIARGHLCDAVADCERGEDEAYCVALAPTLFPDENILGIPASSSKGYLLLRVKGLWYTYYNALWNKASSDIVCTTLGFRESLKTEDKAFNLTLLMGHPRDNRPLIRALNMTLMTGHLNRPIHNALNLTPMMGHHKVNRPSRRNSVLTDERQLVIYIECRE